MEWFPALRKRLAARGVHLPDPYPYTARTFKGSVLATLLAAILFLIAYAVWEAASYTARNVQRTAFMTIETTAATSRLVTEKAGQAVEALFPKPAPVTEASLESILPPGSHLGNQMKDAIRQNTLPYQEGSGTLTDAARQIDFALLQTVLRLKLDKGRILLLTSDYRTQGKDIYHLQRMRIYLPPVVQDPAQQAPRNENGNAPSAETGDVKGPPEPVFRFLNALAESLDTWADRAVLTESPGKLTLATKGVLTHEIWFEATTDAFPILPPTDKAPRLTIVMNELGGDKAVTASLLALKLPITFSVLPFAKDAAATATAAHEAGQEVLVDMPMETMQSPFVKAGPGEITTKMSEEDMRILMDDALGHVPYATGASNFMGSRLTTDTAATRRFCEILARSGLYVLDDVTHQESILYAEARRRGLPAWRRALTLNDGPKTEGAVLADLKKAEETARAKGHAVVIATARSHGAQAVVAGTGQGHPPGSPAPPARRRRDVCLGRHPLRTAGRSHVAYRALAVASLLRISILFGCGCKGGMRRFPARRRRKAASSFPCAGPVPHATFSEKEDHGHTGIPQQQAYRLHRLRQHGRGHPRRARRGSRSGTLRLQPHASAS